MEDMADTTRAQASQKEQALRQLYSKHSRRIFERALRLTGKRELAFSVVRGVFEALYTRLDPLADEEAYNTVIDTLMEAQLQRVSPPESPAVGEEIPRMAVLEAQESSQEPENLGGQVSGAVLSPHPMEEAGEEAVSERRGISRILTVALIGIMVALVLWCIGGLLMKMRILPELDIGYTWFNEHIYPLF